MDIGFEMLFETTIRTILGEKACHIAGQVYTEKHRKEWFRKALKKIIEKIQQIDTSTKHKEQLAYWSEEALRILQDRDFSETKFSLYLLRLIGVLLGFVGVRGAVIATPMYFRTPSQYYTESIMGGGDVMQDYYDSKNSVSVRKRLIKQLKKEGINDFQISLILNISEYQIKKLRKEL